MFRHLHWAIFRSQIVCRRRLYSVVYKQAHSCPTRSRLCGTVKVIPQQAEVAQGVPGRLRPRIFLTFGTTRVVGRQSYAPAAFTPGNIPGTHFQKPSRPQGTWFRRGEPRKKIASDTTRNRSWDCPTCSAVP